MVYADVIVGKRGSSEELTYAVPAEIIPYIGVGSLVLVPVRDKRIKAIVVKLHRRVAKSIKGKIRQILSIDKKMPVISINRLDVAKSLARKYLTNNSDVVFRLLGALRNITSGEGTKQGKLIYLQAVWTDRAKYYREAIGKYQEVLIIFPTNQHLKEFKKNLSKSFSPKVVVLSRGKSLKSTELSERVLFLGTVGSSFLPIKPGGLIIIDQPNHIGSRYANRPYLKSEDIALARLKYEGTDVLVAQSMVTFQQLMRIKNKEAGMVTIAPPKTEIVVSSRVGSGTVFLPSTVSEISKLIKNKKSVCLFVASKGWASGYYCRSCQELVKCDNCRRTIGADSQRLSCNYCGYNKALPNNCPNCGKTDFIALGEGIDRVIKEVREIFTGVQFQVVAGAAKYSSDINLTISTEKILSFPGAKFDQMVIVSADRALSGGAVDDGWKFLLILKELAAMSEKLTIQTYLLENIVWASLTAPGLRKYFEQELAERKYFSLPPYSKELIIIGSSRDKKTLKKQRDKIIEGVESGKNVEHSTAEILRDKSGQYLVRIQIIFPHNDSQVLVKVAELTTPNWAVLPN